MSNRRWIAVRLCNNVECYDDTTLARTELGAQLYCEERDYRLPKWAQKEPVIRIVEAELTEVNPDAPSLERRPMSTPTIVLYQMEEDCWCLEIDGVLVACDYDGNEETTIRIYDHKHFMAMLEAAVGCDVPYEIIYVNHADLGLNTTEVPMDLVTWAGSLEYRRQNLETIREAVAQVLRAQHWMPADNITRICDLVIDQLVDTA